MGYQESSAIRHLSALTVYLQLPEHKREKEIFLEKLENASESEIYVRNCLIWVGTCS